MYPMLLRSLSPVARPHSSSRFRALVTHCGTVQPPPQNPDTERTRLAADLAQTELKFGKVHGSERLVAAVIHDRRVKSSIEIAHMTRAIEHTEAAFRTIMGSTHAGETEAGLTALFEASLAAKGLTTGYATILSQRGEVLHNHHHDLTLENGQLLLVDGGGVSL